MKFSISHDTLPLRTIQWYVAVEKVLKLASLGLNPLINLYLVGVTNQRMLLQSSSSSLRSIQWALGYNFQ